MMSCEVSRQWDDVRGDASREGKMGELPKWKEALAAASELVSRVGAHQHKTFA